MVKILFIAMLTSMLSGCWFTKNVQPTVVPAGAVEVRVPFPTCGGGLEQAIDNTKQTVRPPALPIQTLTEADSINYDKVQKAYTDSIAILVEYVAALEADQTEIQLQCATTKAAANSLNTTKPIVPSTQQ